jgi:hypothetical protein
VESLSRGKSIKGEIVKVIEEFVKNNFRKTLIPMLGNSNPGGLLGRLLLRGMS